ncbi:MAG: hypothetical protein K6T33_09120 [Thermomonas hydrothermalis]|uniref:hypothetical protein n=1 Tax=Thermomonas hydrothermalis TaxID=213588 RepID=UPI002356D062|nr:hypothetical protein [Thermomonas hydrothermalis]MCL6619934.1 hypothetical protein [Thermomonas hydrothermalis]
MNVETRRLTPTGIGKARCISHNAVAGKAGHRHRNDDDTARTTWAMRINGGDQMMAELAAAFQSIRFAHQARRSRRADASHDWVCERGTLNDSAG